MRGFAKRVTQLHYPILFGLVAVTFFLLGKQCRYMNEEAMLPAHYSSKVSESLKSTPHSNNNDLYQTISECSCRRKFFYSPPRAYSKILNSSCSDEGSFYQTGQTVVSLSMYFNNTYSDLDRIKLYREGISENLQRMKKFYPGSTMRIYTNITLEPDSDYCKLLCDNPALFWCDIRKTPSLGDQSHMNFRTWRFLPLGDPTVDYFLSRDLDSVLIERQVAAVFEWLQSGKAFHVMRDKEPEHFTPILAGLWGARNSVLGMSEAITLRNEIMNLSAISPRGTFRDQEILNKVIFIGKKSDVVAFDSFSCKFWKAYTEVRPFPIKRKNNVTDFAGNIGLGRAIYSIPKCPVECRPEYGKDWEYC